MTFYELGMFEAIKEAQVYRPAARTRSALPYELRPPTPARATITMGGGLPRPVAPSPRLRQNLSVPNISMPYRSLY